MENMKLFKKDKRAVTVLEVMAAVIIFSIIVALFAYAISMVNSLYTSNNQMAGFISDGHIASIHLLNNIRPARKATISGNRLTLEYYDQVSNPDIAYTFTGSKLECDGTTVVERVDMGQSSFSLSGNLVTVEILFEHNNIKYPIKIRGLMRSA